MSGALNAQTRSHRFEFDIPQVYDREPHEIAKLLWKASHVPPERYVHWTCPCCSGVKAIYAPDDHGRVWLILTSSTRTDGRDVVALEHPHEVGELVEAFPHAPDRFLIAGWYAAGLDDQLLRLFGS